MNKYLVTVRVKGRLVKTTLEADSVIHAKLLAEWHYGFESLTRAPSQIKEQAISTPQTPEQARVKALQAQSDKAKQAVKAEKARQNVAKAQQQITTARQSLLPTP